MGRTHSHCRHCGFGVPTDAPLCPGCRRPAIDDWHRRTRQLAAPGRSPRHAPPPLREHGYRSLLRRAELARSALWLAAVAGVATTVTYLLWIVRIDDPALTVGSTPLAVASLSRSITVVLLALVAITGVAFVAWALRAYRNLPALGIRERRYWTVWLIIGWLIPGANLLVPKLVVDDIWRASSPQVPIDGGAGWQRRPVASVVNRWWCSLLVTPAVTVLAVITAGGGLAEAEQQAVAGGLSIAAAAALVIAAIAARRLIAVVTVAQARRADVIVDLRENQQAARAHLQAAAWSA